jgi:hypothetical protein
VYLIAMNQIETPVLITKYFSSNTVINFFIANIIEAGSGLPFPQFFQKNRDGDPKGIIVVKLGELL